MMLDLLELFGLMMQVMLGLNMKFVGCVNDLNFLSVRFFRCMWVLFVWGELCGYVIGILGFGCYFVWLEMKVVLG